MIIDGKCKERFWNWYFNPKRREKYGTNDLLRLGGVITVKTRFESLNFSEQWGVLQDYFDWEGLIFSFVYDEDKNKFGLYINDLEERVQEYSGKSKKRKKGKKRLLLTANAQINRFKNLKK